MAVIHWYLLIPFLRALACVTVTTLICGAIYLFVLTSLPVRVNLQAYWRFARGSVIPTATGLLPDAFAAVIATESAVEVAVLPVSLRSRGLVACTHSVS